LSTGYRTMKDSEIWSLNFEVWSPKSEDTSRFP
jgi:hypothetical protein